KLAKTTVLFFFQAEDGIRDRNVTGVQTCALPISQGYTLEEASALRNKNPKEYVKASQASMHKHVALMLEFQKRGAVAFDYGNNISQVAFNNGLENAFDFPGFVPAYIRPLFCEGKGPFRFAALSGDPTDIERADEEMRRLFPENEKLIRWLNLAQEKIAFQGLPSRIAWLGYGERAKMGLALNRLV